MLPRMSINRCHWFFSHRTNWLVRDKKWTMIVLSRQIFGGFQWWERKLIYQLDGRSAIDFMKEMWLTTNLRHLAKFVNDRDTHETLVTSIKASPWRMAQDEVGAIDNAPHARDPTDHWPMSRDWAHLKFRTDKCINGACGATESPCSWEFQDRLQVRGNKSL